MNGPMVIYKLKPIFSLPPQLDLPNNMYKIKNPVACVTNTSDHTDDEKEVLAGITDKKPIPELASLEARWDFVLQQIADLRSQMATIKETVTDVYKLSGCTQLDSTTLNNLKMFQGAVINANPSNPPYSLLLLKHIYKSSLPISFNSYVHSSISSLPDHIKCFNESATEFNNALKLVLIWKDDITDTELILNPVKQIPIKGEVNILRYFAHSGLTLLKYPLDDALETVHVDSVLDLCHRLLHVKTAKEKASLFKNLNAKLGRCSYFGGENINISDISAYSALKQINVNPTQDLTPSMIKWYLAHLGLTLLKYPLGDALETVHIDSVLDLCHRLLHVKTAKEKASLFKNLNAKLGRCSYFGGENINISDISAYSALKPC